MHSQLRLVLTLAGRELRSGIGGFRIFLACLILGVGAIAGIGNLGAAINRGLAENGQALLGGDLEFRLIQREATAEERAFLAGQGEILSEQRQMRAMARLESGTQGRTLVELKAVDAAYPLYGRLTLAPALSPAEAFAGHDGLPGAAVAPELLARIDGKLGDRLTIGQASFVITAVIDREPDVGTGAFGLGPRVMIALDDLAATGLVQTGSQIQTGYHLKLAPGADFRPVVTAVEAQYPEAGWRIGTRANAAPGTRQFVDRIGQFLTLVGLTALVVGGVGVGSAVRAHMATKTRTIAILKSIGAPAGLVFSVFMLQVMAVAVIGIALGLLLGAVLPVALGGVIGAALPVPTAMGVYPGPLVLAAVFGFIVAALFALWPLARAREVPAAHLFRDLVAPDRVWPRPRYLVATGLLVLALAALALFSADEISFGLYFIVGTLLVFLLLRFAGWLVAFIAARVPRPRRPGPRLALANLHRPGAATGSVVLSLGLGLTLLVGVALVQFNLGNQVADRLPNAAPSFFFVDIQRDQYDDFVATVAGVGGTADLKVVPAMRGRIAAIKGVPAEDYPVKPDGRWALRGDRGVTYAPVPPEGTRLVSGEWWPADYRGPQLVSFDARLADAMDLAVGDTITINLLGRDIEARIASLRDIDYTTLTINFALVFSPGMLEAAPHGYLATVRATPEAEPKVFRAVTDRFANVSVIRMKEALEMVDNLLGQLGLAVQVTASVTLVAGLLVLAGSLAAGHRQRLYDAVILKTLGASRAQVLGAFVVEYAVLGLATGVIALGAGTAAGYGVIVGLMNSPFVFDPLTALLAASAGVVLTVVLGLVGTWGALAGRPAAVLRSLD